GQISVLKKQNIKASDYAKRSIDELFSAALIENSITKEVRQSASVIAINDGRGNFEITELPYQVQLSCVCGISCRDLNNDGFKDIIMGGNNFEFKPQYSQLDANFGSVLLSNGGANYEWQNYNESGFYVRGEIKHLQTFSDANGKMFMIVALNNDKPKIFALND
ncbi:MAG: hypothetical protein ACI828_002541, partial [Flavobacteriales bacterium]